MCSASAYAVWVPDHLPVGGDERRGERRPDLREQLTEAIHMDDRRLDA
jgi:hypothetical protein